MVVEGSHLTAAVKAHRRPGQVWVAFSMESDASIPALADPAVIAGFDLTMTYQRSADVWVPYLSEHLVADLLRPPAPKTAVAPVARVQSNSYDRSGRNAYAAGLMRRLKVASYGAFARTAAWPTSEEDEAPPDYFWREASHPEIDGPRPGDLRLWSGRARAAKIEVIGRHKFTLAFENSVAPDYVTEKFFDPLVAGSVPVYLGAPNVADFAPGPHSYIDTADFSGPDDLARYLDHLDRHDDEYQAYLAWKDDGLSDGFRRLVEGTWSRPFCRLAELVRDRLPGDDAGR